MEVWKQIPEFEGLYEASTLGRIKSLEKTYHSGRNSSHVRTDPEIIMKFRVDKDGYFKIKLMKDGVSYHRRVGRMICITFHDNPGNLPVVNHKDGNKQNDRVDNLEWTTYSGNTQHAFDNELIDVCRGDRHVWSKLKEYQIKEILDIYKIGTDLTFKEVGDMYGVKGITISRIVRGERWKEHSTGLITIDKKPHNHRKVIHLETGEIYDSVTNAANANGIRRDVLRNYLVGKRLKKKLPFDFYDN